MSEGNADYVDMGKPGYVYLVQMERSSYYKIGRSVDVPRRMSDFGILLPFPHRLVFARRVPHAPYAEESLHRKFEAFRTNGEWFKLTHYEIQWADLWLQFVQCVDSIERFRKVFDEDPVYIDSLYRYARIFAAMSRRHSRRLENLCAHLRQKPITVPVISEAVS